MREILFHGKRLDNGEWVYGFYIGDTGDGCHEICDINSTTGHRVDVDPATVGQYTGLPDKNGKRIFEGDLVKYHDRIFGDVVAIIIYSNSGACFCAMSVKCHNNQPALDIVMNESEIEIIGNIHDNPELLEGGGAE